MRRERNFTYTLKDMRVTLVGRDQIIPEAVVKKNKDHFLNLQTLKIDRPIM